MKNMKAKPVKKALTLKAILALCPPDAMALSDEDKRWLHAPAKGNEILPPYNK